MPGLPHAPPLGVGEAEPRGVLLEPAVRLRLEPADRNVHGYAALVVRATGFGRGRAAVQVALTQPLLFFVGPEGGVFFRETIAEGGEADFLLPLAEPQGGEDRSRLKVYSEEARPSTVKAMIGWQIAFAGGCIYAAYAGWNVFDRPILAFAGCILLCLGLGILYFSQKRPDTEVAKSERL